MKQEWINEDEIIVGKWKLLGFGLMCLSAGFILGALFVFLFVCR